MCTELPKEFEKTSDVLPFTKYGVSTLAEFQNAEEHIQHLELLKKAGLTDEEVKLYEKNEAGLLDQQKKVESTALKEKLHAVYTKIRDYQETKDRLSKQGEPIPGTSTHNTEHSYRKTINFYPEGHPINELKEIEENLFGHLRNDDILPITKRRKILRRLERRKDRILAHQKEIHLKPSPSVSIPKLGSLWDVKDIAGRIAEQPTRPTIGPKDRTMYTIKENRIVRLEQENQDEFRAVDIVIPRNRAEERLLEGTKMNLEDIKSIERFRDYKPGIPSKVLYLKNIAPSVTPDKLSLLFNQFQLENGGPIDVRLLGGRMRGQAFVTFRNEDLAIQALDEVNGTILSGRPIIAEFGRNSNRVQDDL
ncbi:unnamed protein product [Leptosia nina]|uniref:RRM domain-containing protein n=1 Tax=Leptosia nina TaxID=320188 RepID=A0AAV1IZ44_9NEOP